MTCNTISPVSRLIWKCFRRKFTDIFEDVCSLHTCFSADSFHLLCCITPYKRFGTFFFGPPGTYLLTYLLTNRAVVVHRRTDARQLHRRLCVREGSTGRNRFPRSCKRSSSKTYLWTQFRRRRTNSREPAKSRANARNFA